MRSLTVINVMLGKGLGVIEQSFVDYLVAFDKLGHRSIGILSRGAHIRADVPMLIKTHSVLNLGEWDFLSALTIKNIIVSAKPDLVIVHGRRAAKLTSLFSIEVPVVGVAHNYSLEYLLKLPYVFAVTHDLENCLLELGFDRTKLFHMPNMIDTSVHIKGRPFRSPPVIGVLGRFVKKKGFDIFIQALSILQDAGIKFQAVIAGDGEEKASLKALARELKLDKSVKFVGWVKDKAEFFSSIDIFCLPSLIEPFGIVLLEAMLHLKPTVSFIAQGPSEIGIDNENIIFAELGNKRDLADKLEIMLKNEARARKLAAAGCAMVRERYSLDCVSRLLEAGAKQVVEKHLANKKVAWPSHQ